MGVIGCCSYFLIITILGLLKVKKRIYAYLKYQSDRFNHFKSETEIVFNDEMVTFRNFEKYLEYKWTCFYNYTFQDNTLILTTNMTGTEGIDVHSKDLEKEECENLLKLVGSKILKKIK